MLVRKINQKRFCSFVFVLMVGLGCKLFVRSSKTVAWEDL